MVFTNDDRVDSGACLEADLVQGSQVGRVGNGDSKAIPSLVQWNNPVRGNQFAINRCLRDVRIVVRAQVEYWVAEGVRGELGNFNG